MSVSDIWRQIHDYQHGYIIAAISVAWFGLVAGRLAAGALRPDVAGSALLAVALLAWLVAFNANSQMVHQLLFPAAVWSAALAVGGWTTARQFIVPIGFIYFAMPIWDYFLPALQFLSVLATESMLHVIGIPAEVREHVITIPEGTFEIIEGCSGKRYFMVALATGVLGASVSGLRRYRFVWFVALCGGLALLANWLRIIVVIYAGHTTNMQHYLVAVEHKTLGHVIFAILLVAVFMLARRLSDAPRASVPANRDAGAETMKSVAHAPSAWRSAIPLAVLASAFALTLTRANVGSGAAAIGTLPLATKDWQGPLPPQSAWAPQFTDADGERRASYSSVAGIVEVYANAYAEQRQSRELVGYHNKLLAPGLWSSERQSAAGTIATRVGRLVALEARNGDGDLWLVTYTFEVGGWRTTSKLGAQLAYGIQSLLGPTPAGVIALAVRCDQSCEAARTVAGSFWDDMSAPLLTVVPDEART